MFGALTLGILNIILWALLLVSSLYFFKMLNQRFGEKFKSAKLHLMIVITFFSISFLIRSLWDLIIPYTDYSVNVQPKTNATVIFFFYMLTEYLPIASIYFTHAYAFYRLSLSKRKSKTKPKKSNTQNL